MSSIVTVAEYLFKRLLQLGVGAVHGVPGDYNLTLLDYVEPSGLQWVGNTNELNAGYAADGYSRVKGIGALITTFGVGELSAINAIAGAYAERAAVVHIVGIPSRAIQDARLLVHHTFNDGQFGRFAEMYKQVTVGQTRLWDLRTIPSQIDWILQQCLLHSRPVYIEVPVDLVASPVDAGLLSSHIRLPSMVATASHDEVVRRILDKVYAARQPVIFVDGETRAAGIVEQVRTLVSLTGWPTWTTGFSKSLLDETWPNVFGVYRGGFDAAETRNYINEADLVLFFGPHLSSTNTYLYSSIPDRDDTLSFGDVQVTFGNEIIRDAPSKVILPRIIEQLDTAKLEPNESYAQLPKDQLLSFSDVSQEQRISQDFFWRIVGNLFRPGDIIMGETGTSGYGVRDIPLPPGSQLFSPVTWLSIGYMLPAAQGAALAQRELAEASKKHGTQQPRTILFIGDGSFQMTVQELSTIIHLELNVMLFLVNNDGYTIERCIHGAKQRYNDVPTWRYLQAAHFFGGPERSFTRSVKTWAELQDVLRNEVFADGSGLRMVEVLMGREDAPAGPLTQYLERQRIRDA